MHALRTATVCPKDNDKVFNLPRNSEPHRHDDAIISVRHSRREASLLPLIYISLHQHRPLRLQNHSFIKAGLAAFVLVQLKFTKCSFVTHSLGSFSPPLSSL